VLNTIPNQAYYNGNIVTDESVILEDKIETSTSRSEDYDLGIDSIDVAADSDYWIGDCSSECIVVESMIPKDIRVKVTNYGSESVDDVVISLRIKITEDGWVQYNNTLSSEAFPEGHPMHISDDYPLESGDSIVFTFNRTNDRFQRIFDDRDENKARHSIFLVSGLSYVQANIIGEDADASNNHLRRDVEVAKWIENGEGWENEIGPSITFGDTDDNGANSLDYINMHIATDFDHDVDGCGWARDCTDDDGTENISAALNGNSAFGTFNNYGWYKEDADSSECDWAEFGDDDCPKFTSEAYQDDFFRSPPLDLSGMEEMNLGFTYRGNLEEGDVFNLQISKDWMDWENIGYLSSDNTSMEWAEFELDSEKFEGYFGSDDTDYVSLRFQTFSDGDDITECGNSPCSIFFIDNIILRGEEKVLRDVAVGDLTVDTDFAVKSSGNSSWREINVTVINAGESSWTDLPVRISVENLQGEDMSHFLDNEDSYLNQLAGNSEYGDINQDSSQNELFFVFHTPETNVYFVTAEVLVPAGKDFVPANNSKTIKLCIFSDGDDDDDDCIGNNQDECHYTPDGEEVDEYGCSYSQRDTDSDGITNGLDDCIGTPAGEEVDEYGCSASQRDTDNDGITDDMDNCSDTPDGEEVDDYGCSSYQNGGPYLNAFPTGSGGDIEDYEMSLDVNEGGANITVEATELVNGIYYKIDWYIYEPDTYGDLVAEGEWSFNATSNFVEYSIEQEVFNELGTGCYQFIGRLAWYDEPGAGGWHMIEGEDWPFTLDMPFSACEGPDEGPMTFVCGDGVEVPFLWVNDGEEDCADGSDEQQYDEFGDRINWFDCHDGSEVWIEQVNNGLDDCPDGEDEGGEEGECPFSSEDYCYEYGPYCDSESPDYDPVYCGEGTAHYCLEDGSDDEGCTWLVDACAAGQESEELCNAFENFDHELYHADDFPIITLLGENVLTLTQSSEMNYVDAGASCFDAQDGDITNNIAVHGAVVNYNNEGSYVIFYDCTDSDGNHATTQSRTVIVQADTADDNGNVTGEEIEPEEVASISLIPVLISIGLLTIVRRRFNR